MKNLKLLNVIVFLFLFISNPSYSQFDNIGQECGTDQYSGGLKNIPVRTATGEYVRALVIYVTVKNDITPKYALTIWDPPPTPTTATRPINPYPDTQGKLIYDVVDDPNKYFMERFPDYTISDYFCEMSRGQYDVIGDEVYLITPESEDIYADLGYDRNDMNRYILQYLNQTQNIVWSNYDNWDWDEVTSQWIFGQPDGEAEMIMIVYRNLPLNYDPDPLNQYNGWFWSSSYGGEAHLGDSPTLFPPITFGNVTINYDNGITALNFRHNTTHSEIIMIHEYSHKVFGTQIPLSSDGYHINHGMMTSGHDASTYVMSPFERSAPVVGYINYTLISSTPSEPITLHDFVESGEVLKIPIPETSNDFFWVSNHQKVSVFDGVLRGGKDCYSINFAEQDPPCDDGKGIIIERQGSGCSNVNQYYDIVSAEGKYDWYEDRTVYVPIQNYHHQLGFNMKIPEEYYPGNINTRYLGKDEYKKTVLPGVGTIISNDPCSDGYLIQWQNRGDKEDAFNMGYDEIFSPYSNPSTKICNTSHGANLTIALVGESDGAIDVKIYFEDSEALSDLPPSKPKNLNVTKEMLTSNKYRPKLTWDANIEPDFIDGGSYHIFRGMTTDCNTEPGYYVPWGIVPAGTTELTDYSVTLYSREFGSGICQTQFQSYSYKISAVDNTEMESVRSDKDVIYGWRDPCAPHEGPILNTGNETPTEFALKQNFPNPFNPTTNIQFDLPNDVFVSIKVYDVVGKEVSLIVNEFKKAGSYIVSFNGKELSSGVYFYKIEAGSFTDIKRMVLIK